MNKKLLIIDDDNTFLKPICTFLDALGITYDRTNDPLEATDLFEQSSYDLVFCDLEMPRAKGSEIIPFMKSEMNVRELETKIYLVTGVEKIPSTMLKSGLKDIEVIYKMDFRPNKIKSILRSEGFL